MGSGRGGRWGAEAKSSVCTGSLCREPRAGLEAASVFSVSWCLQQILTTVELYSVVCVSELFNFMLCL